MEENQVPIPDSPVVEAPPIEAPVIPPMQPEVQSTGEAPIANPSNTLSIVDRNGRIFEVTREGAQEAVASGKWRLETPEEIRQRKGEEIYGSRPFAAAAAAVARGLVPGGSDVALREMGVSQETLSGLKEFNQTLSTGAEIGTSLAAILASGGLSGAAKVGTAGKLAEKTIPAMLARAGAKTTQATAGAIAKTLGETSLNKTAKKFIEKSLSYAAGGALEGAAYGATNALSEMALGDPNDMAEVILSKEGLSNILKGAASGAKVGGLFGAGLGGVESLGTAALEAPITQRTLKRMQDESKKYFENFASKKAVKAMGPYSKEQKLLYRNLGDANEVGDHLLEKGVIDLDQDFISRKAAELKKSPEEISRILQTPTVNMKSSYESILEDTKLKREFYGEKIGKIADKFYNNDLDGIKIYDKIDKEIIKPLEKYGTESSKRMAERMRSEFEPLIGMDNLGSIRDYNVEYVGPRQKLNKLAPIDEQNVATIFQDARRVIEDHIEDSIGKATKGTLLENKFEDFKKRYASYKWANNTVKNRLEHMEVNRSVSTSDYGIGSVIGGATALASGGINPGAIASGFVAGTINKVLRTRGNAMLAASADQINRLALLDLAKQRMNKVVRSSVSNFLLNNKRALVAPLAVKMSNALDEKSKPMDFNEMQDFMMQYAQDPSKFGDQEQGALASAYGYAPNTATALTMKLATALGVLNDKMPKSGTHSPLISAPWKPSDQELARWNRLRAALNDPLNVIKEMEAGYLSPESVEIMQTVYPQMYQNVKTEFISQIEKLKTKGETLPYEKRLLLSKFFGAPLDQSMDSNNVKILQSNFVSGALSEGTQRQPGASRKGVKEFTVPGSFAGTSETSNLRRAEYR